MIKGMDELLKRLGGIQKAMEDADAIVARHAFMAEREAKRNLTKNRSVFTGTLRNSITTRKLGWAMWIVGTSVKYARPVEYGTRPHRPPLRPLVEYVRLKNRMGTVHSMSPRKKQRLFAMARGLQRKIERDGTEPHPFMRPAYEMVRFQLRDALVDKLAGALKGR